MTMPRLALTALLLASLAAALPAQDIESQPASPKAEMKGINQSLKEVKTFLKEPDGEPPIAAVVKMQKLALEAKLMVPRLTEQQAEDQRAAFLVAYRKKINELLRGMLDLEDALAAKDWKAAEGIVATLDQVKKDGHPKFKGRRQRSQ